MVNFNAVDAPKKVNIDFVLSKVQDHTLFAFYFGKFDLKTTYKSNLRSDRNPSVSFFINSRGKVIFHDFATGEKHDIISYINALYNCSTEATIKRIVDDFGLIGNKPKAVTPEILEDLSKFEKIHKGDTIISYSTKAFDDKAKEFWKSYSITRAELKREGVHQIEKLYINENFIPNRNEATRFALTVPHKGELRTKIYSPVGEDTLKWVNNIPNDVAFGMHNLEIDCDILVITKSMKDMIILRKFFPTCIAVQNEGEAFFNNKENLDFLQQNFKEIWINFDNDDTGLRVMNVLEDKYGFLPFHLPVNLYTEEGIKDISDLVKAKGLDSVKQYL